jgi:CheY-like chemotaxis protein
MPFKSARVMGEPAGAVLPSTGLAADFAEQALRWLPNAQPEPTGVLDDLFGPPPAPTGSQGFPVAKGRILVIDDNADMRDYLRRLLRAHWNVEVAADGETGLAAAQRLRPEVILADVMMPGLDGFEVVKRVREDPALGHTPVVLVTARAGEAAAIEGLMAGADNYIAKPFSPRELMARLQATLDRTRAETALRESESKYRGLFLSIDTGYCVIELLFDEAGAAIDYVFLEANPAFEKQTGLLDAMGRSIRALAPKHEAFWFETYGRIARTGVPERFEHRADALDRWYSVYAFRIGKPQQHRVAVLLEDITERKLRELHTALLDDLSQDLARLSAPDEIMQAVGERVGTFLKVSSCLFCDVDEERDEVTVHHGWTADGVPGLKQTLCLKDHVTETFARAQRAGETFVVRDTATDERTDAQAHARLGVRAFVARLLLSRGRWVAYFSVTDTKPRD